MGCGSSSVGVAQEERTQTSQAKSNANNDQKPNGVAVNGVSSKQKVQKPNNAKTIDTNGNTVKTDQTPGECWCAVL